MNKTILNKTQLFLYELGYNKIKSFKQIKGGINSQVYKLKVDKISLVLKLYSDKNKLRIKREKKFYNYLNKIHNNNVLKPIGFNISLNIALFPFINGNKIKKINNKHMKKILLFLDQINKKKSIKLPLAVDGIKDRKNHIKLC
ncbi:hypothetical protein N9F75_02120, partial [Candidatus Pelagibacter ubique]|nr:hypothetical protein [Candidatus Pelagibacter ubique]